MTNVTLLILVLGFPLYAIALRKVLGKVPVSAVIWLFISYVFMLSVLGYYFPLLFN